MTSKLPRQLSTGGGEAEEGERQENQDALSVSSRRGASRGCVGAKQLNFILMATLRETRSYTWRERSLLKLIIHHVECQTKIRGNETTRPL